MPERVMFTMGDIACAEGALSAGCRYLGGYPITPATEIAEWMARRLPEVGGAYVQYEDEMIKIPNNFLELNIEEQGNILKRNTYRKFTDWSYENECRVLIELDSIENKQYLDIPPESVIEVIIGLNCNLETELALKNILNEVPTKAKVKKRKEQFGVTVFNVDNLRHVYVDQRAYDIFDSVDGKKTIGDIFDIFKSNTKLPGFISSAMLVKYLSFHPRIL